ncbi:uncharacterized protein LOC133997317 isoform X1 [Scomber scombrus]|uniref:uncharacterized protein LOC133997317 isoform X1 n=1 Tax=Scomber scombrus TaxID=13677 RepID=UPI002DD85D89|nr:uncharacterized protein LOC133997317 isoform X1 [Scomber scombrus]
MVEFKWIKMFLFLILGLQFTAVTGQTSLDITVRDGDEATLSCENVMTDQDKCNSTNWIFVSTNTAVVELIKLGQIGENAKDKSDRLSVTADCSLVIKKVTVEDVGQYTCRQFKSGQRRGRDSVVDLSVVSMTEHKDNDEVKLSCSVSTYDGCRHTVKWLYRGSDLDINTRDVQIPQSTCSATVVLLTSHLIYTSNSKFLQCEVTDIDSGKVQLYHFSPQLSGEATTTEPATTATQEDVKATPPTTKSTIQSRAKAATTKTPAATDATAPPGTLSSPVWWLLVAVASAALIVAAVVVVVAIRRKKTTGNNTQMIQGLSLNPAVTQSGLETSQDTVDPEDGVSYASISYTKKTNSKAWVCGDDDDAVTYSTVKVSSSSAGASTDPSNLYATVNKPNN